MVTIQTMQEALVPLESLDSRKALGGRMTQRLPPVLPPCPLPGRNKEGIRSGPSVGEGCESDICSQRRLGVALRCTSSEKQPGLLMPKRNHSDQRAYMNSMDPGSLF